MVSIRVSGPAVVFDFHVDGNDPPVVQDPARLATLDGLEHDEVFSEYIVDFDRSLADAGISGGRLYFAFDPKSGVLAGVTEYAAPQLLSETELAALKDYTIGQWSDGIGSNFLQERMGKGLAPQLPFMDDGTVTIEQR